MESRCGWVTSDPLYVSYHDREWGVPVYDDRILFEFLTLEGAQAGLSWLTILKKRENYRRAFEQFYPQRVALYDAGDVERLMNDSGIVRNRLKIESTISNAQAFLRVVERYGSFQSFIWAFVDGKPRQNAWQALDAVPAATPESAAMSAELKRRGFRFVGPTICYAFMQAVGMVNDHTTGCFRHQMLRPGSGH
ncbi:MAG: DNA-3-methyladenine glycosylase I [Thermaerobacterales bacterium]